VVLGSGRNLWAVIIGHGLFRRSRFVLFYFHGPAERESRQSCLSGLRRFKQADRIVWRSRPSVSLILQPHSTGADRPIVDRLADLDFFEIRNAWDLTKNLISRGLTRWATPRATGLSPPLNPIVRRFCIVLNRPAVSAVPNALRRFLTRKKFRELVLHTSRPRNERYRSSDR